MPNHHALCGFRCQRRIFQGIEQSPKRRNQEQRHADAQYRQYRSPLVSQGVPEYEIGKLHQKFNVTREDRRSQACDAAEPDGLNHLEAGELPS